MYKTVWSARTNLVEISNPEIKVSAEDSSQVSTLTAQEAFCGNGDKAK